MADAFVALTSRIKALGLEVMLNYGTSPFGRGPAPRMRPDPHDPACRANRWTACTTLDDVWKYVDHVVDEGPVPAVTGIGSTAYRESNWATDMAENAANERDASHAGKVIALVKNANSGNATTRRAEVFYQWARVRLWDISVAVNTGDDGCGTSDQACWRYGDPAGNPWPDLASVELGVPLDKAPFAVACEAGSSVRCIWVRRYSAGLVLLNRSAATRTSGRISLGLSSCRYIFRVNAQAFLEPNTCVLSLNRTLGAWSGAIFEYALAGS